MTNTYSAIALCVTEAGKKEPVGANVTDEVNVIVHILPISVG